jgi:hypothetical protein
VVAAVRIPQDKSKSGEGSLGVRQQADPELKLVLDYLETGALPSEVRRARELVLSRQQYVVLEGVLHYAEKDKSLRVIPPQGDRRLLFDEVHAGVFGGHLRDANHGRGSNHP